MATPATRVVLISETQEHEGVGRWQFVVRGAGGMAELSASDTEPEVQGERLELLAVVRGLESLNRPSQVTLMTNSRYVSQGFYYGLEEWRENDWQWEHFGKLVPIKNTDLWQRVDRALEFHHVECRSVRFDRAHRIAPKSSGEGPQTCPALRSGNLSEPPRRRPLQACRRVIRSASNESNRAGSRPIRWAAAICESASAWKAALFPRLRLG